VVAFLALTADDKSVIMLEPVEMEFFQKTNSPIKPKSDEKEPSCLKAIWDEITEGWMSPTIGGSLDVIGGVVWIVAENLPYLSGYVTVAKVAVGVGTTLLGVRGCAALGKRCSFERSGYEELS